MLRYFVVIAAVTGVSLLASAARADTRYWHDEAGDVFAEDSTGSYEQILTASGTARAVSSLASAGARAAPNGLSFSTSAVTFLDGASPPHLQGLFNDGLTTAYRLSDGGIPPLAGCMWTGSPAVSHYQYYNLSNGVGPAPMSRYDHYVNANCAGKIHLFHRVRSVLDTGWVDITPVTALMGQLSQSVSIASSPAAVTSSFGTEVHVLFIDTNGNLIRGHASLSTSTDPGTFAWDGAAASTATPSATGAWASDPALLDYVTVGVAGNNPSAYYMTEHLRVFATTNAGNIEYRDWTARGGWSGATTWIAPSTPCSTNGAPAVSLNVTSGTEMVGCVGTDQVFHAAYGTTSQSSSWYQIASGAYGASLLEQTE